MQQLMSGRYGGRPGALSADGRADARHTHSASQSYGSLLDRTSLIKSGAQVVR